MECEKYWYKCALWKFEQFFSTQYYYTENIHFPLDPQTLPEGSLVKEVFSEGYGKTFVSDLEDSYGQQNRIVKINKKYFFFSTEEPKTDIDLLEELKCNYEKEFNYLENSFNEIKSDLLLDVEQWIENENSKKYISGNEREQLIYMKRELQAKCQKINSQLINRNILSQPLSLEPHKHQLEILKIDVNLKGII